MENNEDEEVTIIVFPYDSNTFRVTFDMDPSLNNKDKEELAGIFVREHLANVEDWMFE